MSSSPLGFAGNPCDCSGLRGMGGLLRPDDDELAGAAGRAGGGIACRGGAAGLAGSVGGKFTRVASSSSPSSDESTSAVLIAEVLTPVPDGADLKAGCVVLGWSPVRPTGAEAPAGLFL